MNVNPYTHLLLPYVEPFARCRVGITMDLEERESTYRADWPYADNFVVVSPGSLTRNEAAQLATKFAQGCVCEYDYDPDSNTADGEWYVYHFEQGGRGIYSRNAGGR